MAEITDRETHKRKWVRSFHTAELVAMEYDRWQVQFHFSAARLNFPLWTVFVHLILLALGVVSAAMARENREERERLEAEAADEAYMEDLRRQTPSLWRRSASCTWSERPVGLSSSFQTTTVAATTVIEEAFVGFSPTSVVGETEHDL